MHVFMLISFPGDYIFGVPGNREPDNSEAKEVVTTVKLVVTNAEFVEDLNNRQSESFKTLSTSLTAEVARLLQHTPDFIRAEIVEFRRGSVIVVMNLVFAENTTDALQELSTQNLISNLEADGLGNYTVGNITVIQDQCIGNPCFNNGYCVSADYGYLCYCLEGYKGLQCEQEYSEHIILKSGCETLDFNEESVIMQPFFDLSTTVINPEVISSYEITGDNYGVFFINETSGELTTSITHFDRETREEYELRCKLVMSGTESLNFDLKIIIIDINDNEPRFQNTPYENILMEYSPFGTLVAVVIATDDDSSDILSYSFDINYSVYLQNMFSIDSRSGEVTTQGLVSRDYFRKYGLLDGNDILLPVTVSDGMFSGRTNILVQIEPLFVKGTNGTETVFREVLVREDVNIGTLVANVGLPDPEDPETQYSYRMSEAGSGNSSFLINETTGEIKTAALLDREEKEINVEITIEDINDNDPVFAENAYTSSVREDTNGPNTQNDPVVVIPPIVAKDDDAGSNADIRYFLSGDGSELFKIDPKTAVITKNALTDLDYEITQMYTLTVTAKDMDGNAGFRMDNVYLNVMVLDMNDNIPVFVENDTSISVSENIAVGTVIGYVNATDADDGQNGEIYYFIQTGSEGKFRLNPDSGELSILSELDREIKEVYELLVVARDKGYPANEASVTVTITLLDVNDNSPVFNERLYVASISENEPIDSYVLDLNATDPDKDDFGLVFYSLEETIDFAIDLDSGILTTNTSFDREKKSVYNIHVLAADGGIPGRTSSVSVHISILDVNDNEPKFDSDQYTATILKTPTGNINDGTIVTVVSANDADDGVNAQITYSIEDENYNDLFNVDDKGVVTVAVGGGVASDEIQFNISATDGGSSTKRATTTVFVKLEAPSTTLIFNETIYRFAVNENEYDITIGKVEAFNPDDTLITYVMPFAIGGIHVNSTTGELTIDAPFDRESKPVVIFNIIAQGDGNFAFTTIEVTFIDVNDEKPVFIFPPNSPFYFDSGFQENAIIPVLLKVVTLDADEGVNADRVYTLVDGDDGEYIC
ncbi:protocadherin Fat 4-like [Saccoglossus kowalevskii]